MLDLLIKNGTIYDGTGAEGRKGALGIRNGRIILLPDGELPEAKEVFDATGLAVSPGFIDVHSHSDAQVLPGLDSERGSKLLQGNTTEIAGQCGSSRFPFLPDMPADEETRKWVMGKFHFLSYAEFADFMNSISFGTNQMCFTGHKALRSSVAGMSNLPLTPAELEREKAILEETMRSGSLGMTTGLVYAPSCYSTEEELVELLKVVARYGGIYSTHLRGEGDTVLEAAAEAIRLGEKAGVPVNISHFKQIFPQNYAKVDRMLEMVDEANRRGMSVTFDAYPYTATSSNTASALPPSYLSKGIPALVERLSTKEGVEELRKDVYEPTETWENPIKNIGAENFLIVSAPSTPEAVGKRVSEYALMHGLDEIEAFADLYVRNRCGTTDCRFNINEDNLEKIYRHPCCMVGSDGLFAGVNPVTHPRAFGTFPRYLGRFIREKKVLPLPEAIRRLTGMAAERYHVPERGFLKDGYVADVTVFNPDTVIDRATYEKPNLENEGIELVIVNGEIRVRHGVLEGKSNGQFLTRKH